MNLHIHTLHSDGTGDVTSIAHAAREAGAEVIILTDHNVYRPEQEGWHEGVLVLVGEELHDPEHPHRNHLLVLGAHQELVTHAHSLQAAIDAARAAGGLPIIAHPIEHSGARADEPEIDWVDRDASGLHGIELWNYMSEFKSYIHTVLHGLLYAYAPSLAMRGPYPATLRLWDELLKAQIVYAYGGSDAHATLYRLGPLRRRIHSYRHLFSAVNTHLLLDGDWTGDVAEDAALIYRALASGRSFVGYDFPAPTRGATYTGERGGELCTYGGRLSGQGETWLRIALPHGADITLIRDGAEVAHAVGRQLEYRTDQPGVYRFEAHRRYRGHRVGWIYGNPIWLA